VPKSFFGNPMLRVSIEPRPGRIHALIGENGAGKSTHMNLLSELSLPTVARSTTRVGATPNQLRWLPAEKLGPTREPTGASAGSRRLIRR
jgi:ABC-type branched-subunit amino acid transport system ATPase component